MEKIRLNPPYPFDEHDSEAMNQWVADQGLTLETRERLSRRGEIVSITFLVHDRKADIDKVALRAACAITAVSPERIIFEEEEGFITRTMRGMSALSVKPLPIYASKAHKKVKKAATKRYKKSPAWLKLAALLGAGYAVYALTLQWHDLIINFVRQRIF